MRIVVLGAGHVGRALLDALHEEHEITVIDVDADRLAALSGRFDVATVEGDGTTKRVVLRATANGCDLFIGCSPREEANLICAMLVKRVSGAQTIIRSPRIRPATLESRGISASRKGRPMSALRFAFAATSNSTI